MTQFIQPLPAGLADVALIDAVTAAGVGGMSASWWLDEVRAGRAPKPVIREHRCTRWRLADVRGFWEARAAAGSDPVEANAVVARATKASTASKAKRLQAPGGVARTNHLHMKSKEAKNG
jgi:hypothetical protein